MSWGFRLTLGPFVSTRPRRKPTAAVKLHRVFLLPCQTSTHQISLRILDRVAFAASAQTVRTVVGAAGAPFAAYLLSGSLGETDCESLVAEDGHSRGRSTRDFY
jgi:hypothetical protein